MVVDVISKSVHIVELLFQMNIPKKDIELILNT